MRHIATALIAVIVGLNPPQAAKNLQPPKTVSPAPTALTILYTSSAQGAIRSCNCTKFRFGGYGRELTVLRAIRKDTPNTVLIEGGDSVQWLGFQGSLKLEVTKKALAMLEYNAMVPGEEELGRSGHRLIDEFDPKQVPIICANLKAEEGGKASYPPYIIVKTKGGLRVGLMGLLDQDIGKLFQQKYLAGVISDPVDALRSNVHRLRSQCDTVVVIFHGPADRAEKLASVKGIDVILSTHRTSREVSMPPKGLNEVEATTKTVNETVLVDAGTKTAWSLGRIDLEFGKNRKVTSAKHGLIYLDRRYEEAPEMVATYEGYNQKVKTAVLTQSSEFKTKMETTLAKRGLNLTQMRERLNKSPFATSGACKSCHTSIHESWSKSRHATAMSTLERVRQDYDPECVTCHTTGSQVRNGFKNLKDTPKLANVQCESCHGPGLAHTQKPAKGYGRVDEATCRGCHTEERTPDFDFEASYARTKH